MSFIVLSFATQALGGDVPFLRSSRLVLFFKAHVSTDVPAVSFRPAAHTSEWSDECPSQLGQGILDSNGLRSGHAPGDQSRGFKIAESSSKHMLGDDSNMATQLPVPIRSLF
jgi:hypothetical protein